MAKRTQQEVEAALRAVLVRCQNDQDFRRRCMENSNQVLDEILGHQVNEESDGGTRIKVNVVPPPATREHHVTDVVPEELRGAVRQFRDLVVGTANTAKKTLLPQEARELVDRLLGNERTDECGYRRP